MTLGCKVNKYESDALRYNLELKGYQTTDKLESADVYIINTCAVTKEAEKKSRQMIARCRKFNANAKIFVCGCASQNNVSQFKDKGICCISGSAGKIKIANYIDQILNDQNVNDNLVKMDDLPTRYEDDLLAKQPRIRAYIKIQDGCNNFCSYCIIPYLRGHSRSRPIFSIINEVSALSDDIKEIVLTGINVTDYKIDGKDGLLTLLQELDTFGKRIRLSSIEESIMSEEFVRGLANLSNFCPHFHLSVQSGCDKTLKDMNRHYTTSEFYKTVLLLRKYFPRAGITTDVIVGFPTESEEDFLQTYNFIQKCQFANLHVFQYSNREGTVASKLYKDISPAIKHERSEKLLTLNNDLHQDFIKANRFGKVLVEEKVDDYFVGFSENYIKCYIQSKENLEGQIVKVKIGKPFRDGAKAKLIKIL